MGELPMRGIWDPWRGATGFDQQRRAARARLLCSRKKKRGKLSVREGGRKYQAADSGIRMRTVDAEDGRCVATVHSPASTPNAWHAAMRAAATGLTGPG